MKSDHPPAYDASNSAQTPDETLPPYEPSSSPPPASTSQHIHPAQPEECPTLVLDGCRIYSRLQQDRALYQLSCPPREGTTSSYSVKKIRHKVSQVNGEQRQRSTELHIYDFKADYLSIGLRDVSIVGKGGPRRTFPEVQMSQGAGPSSFSVAGHFKTDRTLKNRLQRGSEILWKDVDGRLLAVETKVERDGGNVRELPRLEMKAALDEKELDLLVTCWCARIWKQADKELVRPIDWDDVKDALATGPKANKGIWGKRTPLD
ncbi:hypothetical protein B0T10DRAFT_556765 [Thelonectria olida]|uniref:Uncharacterized protein n=1 Tax=Thelonectria olida TaxID=1576542 RepID=A0A9P8WEQ7_9HYPO|nr:hypothetical protein B0T10DRAFT_556765 [Thelonectria olida]